MNNIKYYRGLADGTVEQKIMRVGQGGRAWLHGTGGHKIRRQTVAEMNRRMLRSGFVRDLKAAMRMRVNPIAQAVRAAMSYGT